MTEQEGQGKNKLGFRPIQIESPFPPKMTNKIGSAFDQSRLPVIGGEGDGGVVAKLRDMAAFCRVDYTPAEDPIDMMAFAGALPVVTRTLLASDMPSPSDGYFEGIGGYDFSEVGQIAVSLAENAKREQEVVFRVVYGATTDMPIRALSGILPPLLMMEELQKKGINAPQLQVIFANNTSGYINGKNLGDVRAESARFSELAQAYVSEFFPGLSGSVIFLEDTPIHGEESPLKEEIVFLASEFAQKGKGAMKAELEKKGNGMEIEKKHMYGAAHLAFHETPAMEHLVLLLSDQPDVITPNKGIVNFGGHQERFFHDLRQDMRGKIGGKYIETPVMQYITRHNTPPYMLAQGGDLAFAHIPQIIPRDGMLAKTAVFDLEFLAKTSEKRGSLEDFLIIQAQRWQQVSQEVGERVVQEN